MSLEMLLHVVGSRKLLLASSECTLHCLLCCVDLGVTRCMTRCGKGSIATVGLFESTRITLCALGILLVFSLLLLLLWCFRDVLLEDGIGERWKPGIELWAHWHCVLLSGWRVKAHRVMLLVHGFFVRTDAKGHLLRIVIGVWRGSRRVRVGLELRVVRVGTH